MCKLTSKYSSKCNANSDHLDVWGGFLSETYTKIPTNRWFVPSRPMAMAVSQFKSGSRGFDNYANYAVFLCASTINVISDKSSPSTGHGENRLESKRSYSARWRALFDLLDDWYNSRPEEMHPLISCPAANDDHQNPFPIVLYGNSPASMFLSAYRYAGILRPWSTRLDTDTLLVNGNQLYHTSAILMLQEKPRDVRLNKGHVSLLSFRRKQRL